MGPVRTRRTGSPAVSPDAPTRGSVLAPWVCMRRRLLRRRARNAPDQVHERRAGYGRELTRQPEAAPAHRVTADRVAEVY